VLEKTLQELRIIFAVFLLSMVMIAAAGEYAASAIGPLQLEGKGEAYLVMGVLAFMAIADLGVGFFMRSSMLQSAQESLQKNPNDPHGLRGWRGGNFISFVFAETVVLFGLVVRIFSSQLEFALPFYVVGVAVLLLWAPRAPHA